MTASQIITGIINALIICAFLPLLGKVIDLIVKYVLGGIITLFTRDYNIFVLFFNYLTFPGVVYHELSHALVAIITGAKVDSVTLFEVEDDHLGEVIYYPRGNFIFQSIQIALTSCAPVITGIVGLYFGLTYLASHTLKIPLMILFIYLLLCVFMHMTMSNEDLVQYLKGIWVFFVAFFIISVKMGEKFVTGPDMIKMFLELIKSIPAQFKRS